VLTLLTAQNTRSVQGVFLQPVDVVRVQLRSVADDLGAQATKTGAIGSAELVAAIADELQARPLGSLVVDPVLVSKHGHALAGGDVAAALRQRLLPLATVVTPNRFEANALTGVAVTERRSALAAAHALLTAGVGAVVVKDVPGIGGDLLATADGAVVEIPSPRLATPHRHGSGCTFSAAIAARLAHGDALVAAVTAASDFVCRAIASAPCFGDVGPLNHWA
jgi:hydroxymethylpyrimidine/phosphomethylpyrimidine kinase